jgi:hypothetical protein
MKEKKQKKIINESSVSPTSSMLAVFISIWIQKIFDPETNGVVDS